MENLIKYKIKHIKETLNIIKIIFEFYPWLTIFYDSDENEENREKIISQLLKRYVIRVYFLYKTHYKMILQLECQLSNDHISDCVNCKVEKNREACEKSI